MAKSNSNSHLWHEIMSKKKQILMSGTALLALGAFNPAFAQTADETAVLEDDEIVATGIRQSIKSAQDLKRNADTFLDAITAEDIGALSDRSVAEALARVPGVSISNFAGPNDPDHFSIEGSGVVIRGLTLTRSELNGRDIFTTGLGRTIDFQDFPSELVSAIEVFKNNSADQIEGGLAGTVNLKTRKPFDAPGRVIAGGVDLNHSDLQDQQGITPGGSLLLSDRWDTKIGEFGALVSGSFSRLVNESNATQVSVATLFPVGPVQNSVIDGVFGGSLPNAIPNSDFHIVGGGFRSEERERERYGFNAALQWESPDQRTLATAEFLRSDATLSWSENVVEQQRDAFARETVPGGTGGNAIAIDAAGAVFGIQPGPNVDIPLGGTFLELDESGLFQAGVLTTASSGWRGTATQAPGSCPGFDCGQPGNVFNTLIQSSPQLTTNRGRTEDTDVSNYTFNVQHEFSDRFRGDFDAQYIRSNNEIFDGSANFAFFANTFLDLNDGGIPNVTFLPGANPQLGTSNILPDAEGNLTPEQQNAVNFFFVNPENFFFRSTLRFIEDSDTDELALASNFEYDLDHDWLTGVKFGGRYSDRDQIARATVFDFSFVNEIFDGSQPFSIADLAELTNDPNSAAFGLGSENLVETFDFVDLQRGNVTDPGQFLFAGDFFRSNGSIEGSPLQAVIDEINNPGLGNVFSTLANRNPADDGVDDIIPGTPFRESEITTTSEETFSAYALAKLEKGPVSGKVGVRSIRTNITTDGNQRQDFLQPLTQADIDDGVAAFLAAPGNENLTIADVPDDVTGAVLGTPLACLDAAFITGDGVNTSNPSLGQESALCSLSTADQITLVNFLDGSTQPLTTTNVTNLFLPSLNVKYDLGDGKLLRFAASRTISRPDFSLFRNNQFVSQDDDPNDPSGVRIRADGGNAFISPVSSINLDGSFEWYFADAGSVTASVFWKDLSDVIIQGETIGPAISANGITFEDTEIIGPANVADGNIRGFELAYRQFYDFLPGAFSGFGFEGTYTFVDQSAVPVTAPIASAPGGDGFFSDADQLFGGNAANAFTISQLEGLSRHTINATGLYENDIISARLAYNWRSRFLLTQRDVGSPFPALPVFNEAQGSLDGSIFFNVTDNVKVGLQATNLTNRVIETTQQINEEGDVAPRSFFTNDRRYAFALRFNY